MMPGLLESLFHINGQSCTSSCSARPDEAVSWGKIRMDAKPVKVYTDATLVFPFLVSEAFIPELQRREKAGVELRTQ